MLVCDVRVCRPITQRGLFAFHNLLSEEAWLFVNNEYLSADARFSQFVGVLERAYQQCFPEKRHYVRSDHNRNINWFNNELLLKLLSALARQIGDLQVEMQKV